MKRFSILAICYFMLGCTESVDQWVVGEDSILAQGKNTVVEFYHHANSGTMQLVVLTREKCDKSDYVSKTEPLKVTLDSINERYFQFTSSCNQDGNINLRPSNPFESEVIRDLFVKSQYTVFIGNDAYTSTNFLKAYNELSRRLL